MGHQVLLNPDGEHVLGDLGDDIDISKLCRFDPRDDASVQAVCKCNQLITTPIQTAIEVQRRASFWQIFVNEYANSELASFLDFALREFASVMDGMRLATPQNRMYMLFALEQEIAQLPGGIGKGLLQMFEAEANSMKELEPIPTKAEIHKWFSDLIKMQEEALSRTMQYTDEAEARRTNEAAKQLEAEHSRLDREEKQEALRTEKEKERDLINRNASHEAQLCAKDALKELKKKYNGCPLLRWMMLSLEAVVLENINAFLVIRFDVDQKRLDAMKCMPWLVLGAASRHFATEGAKSTAAMIATNSCTAADALDEICSVKFPAFVYRVQELRTVYNEHSKMSSAAKNRVVAGLVTFGVAAGNAMSSYIMERLKWTGDD